MTILKVTVEDAQAEALKKLLEEVPFIKNIEEEVSENVLQEPRSAYLNIKKILDEAQDKNLFKDIKDPSEWQREIRKEWDRDF